MMDIITSVDDITMDDDTPLNVSVESIQLSGMAQSMDTYTVSVNTLTGVHVLLPDELPLANAILVQSTLVCKLNFHDDDDVLPPQTAFAYSWTSLSLSTGTHTPLVALIVSHVETLQSLVAHTVAVREHVSPVPGLMRPVLDNTDVVTPVDDDCVVTPVEDADESHSIVAPQSTRA